MLILVVTYFHDDMTARNGFTDRASINNDLWQRCAISPVLINLYFSLVFDMWRRVMASQCPGEEFFFFFCVSGRLFNGHRTRTSASSRPDLELADDAALVIMCRGAVEVAVETFHRVTLLFGLTANFRKTKFAVDLVIRSGILVLSLFL